MTTRLEEETNSITGTPEEQFEIRRIREIKKIYAVTVNHMTIITGSYSDSILPLPDDLILFFKPAGLYDPKDLKAKICDGFREQIGRSNGLEK